MVWQDVLGWLGVISLLLLLAATVAQFILARRFLKQLRVVYDLQQVLYELCMTSWKLHHLAPVWRVWNAGHDNPNERFPEAWEKR